MFRKRTSWTPVRPRPLEHDAVVRFEEPDVDAGVGRNELERFRRTFYVKLKALPISDERNAVIA